MSSVRAGLLSALLSRPGAAHSTQKLSLTPQYPQKERCMAFLLLLYLILSLPDWDQRRQVTHPEENRASQVWWHILVTTTLGDWARGGLIDSQPMQHNRIPSGGCRRQTLMGIKTLNKSSCQFSPRDSGKVVSYPRALEKSVS